MTRRGAQEDSEGALSGTVREGQQDIGALVWHAVILSGAKNLALDFSVEKRQGEMLLPQGGISMTVRGRSRERRSLGPLLSTARLRRSRGDVLTSRTADFSLCTLRMTCHPECRIIGRKDLL
jgi:hypothetical protein